jgi:hypothetical protein
MVFLVLVLLLILGAIFLRQFGKTGPLNDAELMYVKLATIPLVLAILVPALLHMVWGDPDHKRWIQLAGTFGLLVSAAMGIWGIMLVRRAAKRRRAWGWPLGGAVLVAGGPALVVYLTTWLLKLMD